MKFSSAITLFLAIISQQGLLFGVPLNLTDKKEQKHAKLELNNFNVEKHMHQYHGWYNDVKSRVSGKPDPYISIEQSGKYWYEKGQDTLRHHLLRKEIKKKAKNVILFLGDGMGISTVTSARVYSGQLDGMSGEESTLSFDKFPHIGLSKTFCVDKQTADSACSATAYLCGVKANYFTVGVNARVSIDQCELAKDPDNHVHSLAYWAQRAGKSTGLVTTTTVTHASPAGVYGHIANRIWECDTDVLHSNYSPELCDDIANQLVNGETGQNLNLILGGGRTKFYPKTSVDTDGKFGERSDGRNLINEWREHHQDGELLLTRNDLKFLNTTKANHVLGLFTPSHFEYNLEANRTTQPSLREMTESAINFLRKNDEGYFLFIEGGRIDHAHHFNQAHIALDETNEFAKAVQAAVDMTKRDDTLIVVTSDHSHTMSLTGFAPRGNNILGTMNTIMENIVPGISFDDATEPISVLSYANGPGQVNAYNADGSRVDLSEKTMDKNFKWPSMIYSNFSAHAGEDVAVYALGPYSHLFSGVYDQHVIPHIIQYATCIGNGMNVCDSIY